MLFTRGATLCILRSFMKKLLYTTIILALICFGQTPTARAAEDAASINHILISEIQTGGATDATEEFVELYNPGEASVDITGWLLQYRAASGVATQKWPNSSTKATITCADNTSESCKVIMQPKTRLVLVNRIANIAGSQQMSGGFSGTGGQIRLVQPGDEPIVQDFVGYGTAQDFESAPAAAPTAGGSIKRIDSADSEPIDSGNNAQDFIASCGSPTPGQDDSDPQPLSTGCTASSAPNQNSGNQATGTTLPAETSSSSEDELSSTNDPSTQALKTYLPVIITELFPDPAQPQLDSSDEFIELYNPNDVAITLKDYHLQTGSDYRYDYILGDTPLPPRGYIAIHSAVSKVSLANSGSGVRLTDPNGSIASEAPNYGDAKEGQSWMQDDTGWRWTLTPTPGAANILTTPAPKITASSTSTKKSTSKSTKTNSTKETNKAAKVPAVKKASTQNEQKTEPQKEEPKKSFDQQYWLLIPFGALAFGYMTYEYRHEIKKTYSRIRQKLIPGKPDSAQNDFD